MLNFIPKYCLLALLVCILEGAVAQKVKEKKDIVYLDDVPQYKIFKTGGSLLKGFSFAATTLEGDTLIRFGFRAVNVPGLPHENIGYFWSYFQTHFTKTGKSVELDYTTKNALIDLIQQYRIIGNGQVDPEAEDRLIEAQKAFTISRIEMDSLSLARRLLLKDKNYAAYSKTLVPRGRGDEPVYFSESKIISGGTSPVTIGTYQVFANNNYGITYHILKKDGSMAASVFFERDKNRVFIRSMFDRKGKEYFIPDSFGNKELLDAVKYLVWYGYI